MASILFAAGLLSYESIKKARAKRAGKKAFNSSRFSELERENAARIAQLHTCSCQRSGWRGGGCETHGFVPAAGEPGGPPAPGYTEVDGAGGVGALREGERTRRDHAPAYEDATAEEFHAPPTRQVPRDTYPDFQYRRGEEDGALADKQGPPRPMPEGEAGRINEERRKRMKAGGFTNWVTRRKRRSNNGDAVVW